MTKKCGFARSLFIAALICCAPSLAGASTAGPTNMEEQVGPEIAAGVIDKSDEAAPLLPAATQSTNSGSGKLTFAFRNYFESLRIGDGTQRQGWVQGMQANYESAFTKGALGIGIDLSPFAAVKLDGGQGAFNMVHLEPDGSGQNQHAWAYLGVYALKVRAPFGTLKYGLQNLSNPFLEPYDIRALPPTFRGISYESLPGALSLKGGSFDAVNARGATQLQPMATAYGAVQFSSLSYAGVDWTYAPNSRASLYVSRAQGVWNQYYFSNENSIGRPDGLKWTAKGDVYLTRSQGAMLEGPIDNKAYSVALSARHGWSTLMVGFQKILGNQFFDYTNETSGIYLANSMALDYNAPHEQSLQFRYSLEGDAVGLPGTRLMLWQVSGKKADGRQEAALHANINDKLHDLYWRAGQPLQGNHHELGLSVRYALTSAFFKNATITIIHVVHGMSPYYSSKPYALDRFMLNMPLPVR